MAVNGKRSHACTARPYGPKGPACEGAPEQHSVKRGVVSVYKSGQWYEFPQHNFEVANSDRG